MKDFCEPDTMTIDLPLVHRTGRGAHARDAVHDQDGVRSGHDLAESLDVIDRAAGGLGEGGEDGLDVQGSP